MPPKEAPVLPPIPPTPPPPPVTPSGSGGSRTPPERRDEEGEGGDRSPPTLTGDFDEVNRIRRLQQLTDVLRRERSAFHVTNPCFELGRPPLQPTEDMRGDVTNIYHRPTTDFLFNLKPERVSNNMASSEEMIKIKVALEGKGVPTEHVTAVLIRLCIKNASTSSSSYQDPSGTIEWPGGAIMTDDVVGKVDEIAGLRRVCRLFAPVTWNYMHIHKCPPSDWAALGFTEETKYAAFDCFDYVQNEAAIKPAGGISPKPTKAEHLAYQTYKKLALNRANNNNTYANLDAEITGGRMGPIIEHNFNHANNRKQ